MNRRSFITKALAGLAAVPLLGKLAQGDGWTYYNVKHKPLPTVYGRAALYDKPFGYLREECYRQFQVAQGPVLSVSRLTLSGFHPLDLKRVVYINERYHEVTGIEISHDSTTLHLKPLVSPTSS